MSVSVRGCSTMEASRRTTEGSLVWNLLCTSYHSDLVECPQLGGQASVNAQYRSVDDLNDSKSADGEGAGEEEGSHRRDSSSQRRSSMPSTRWRCRTFADTRLRSGVEVCRHGRRFGGRTVETVHLGDLSRLVIPSQQGHSFRIPGTRSVCERRLELDGTYLALRVRRSESVSRL